MPTRALAALTSLAGGAAWIVRWFLAGWGGQVAQDELRWIGLVLLMTACLFIGLGLLKGSALWLDAVVGVAALLLAWVGYEILSGVGSDQSTHLVLGVAAVMIGFVLATGGKRPASTRGRRAAPAGRHSRV